eukprot:jgi/Bigna1/125666/aug1.1_g374
MKPEDVFPSHNPGADPLGETLGVQEKISGLGHVSVIATFTSLAGIMMGYSTGVFSGILEMGTFRRDFHYTDSCEGLFTTFLTASAGLAPILFAGSVGDQLGRKPLIIISGALYAVGTLITLSAPSGQLWMIYAGEAITGFGVGGLSAVLLLKPDMPDYQHALEMFGVQLQ